MVALIEIAKNGRKVDAHRPWPRVVVSSDAWRLAIQQLVDTRATLLGLWGDASAMHMALIDEGSTEIIVFTFECPAAKFPSIGALHPPAIRLERAARDRPARSAGPDKTDGPPDARSGRQAATP